MMQSTQGSEIRLLFESDIPAAMKLKEAAGWNQTEADWRRLLLLEPQGCFASIKDGQLVGTTTTTTYGTDLGWVGMVLVDPQNRRQGIATQLMETALDSLKTRVETVKLDATALGKPVYERFGFKVESLIERWVGPITTASVDPVRKALDLDVRRELFDLDRQAFLADRSKLVSSLIDDSPVQPVLKRNKQGKLSGYALARRGTRAYYVGPIVTKQPEQVETLIRETLGQLNGRSVYIDFNTECVATPSVLGLPGFTKERDLIRMSTGGSVKKTTKFVAAIAGPEIG